MLPSENRLIDGIRRSLTNLASATQDPLTKGTAALVQLALNELLLRHDTTFLETQIAGGQALLADAASLEPSLAALLTGSADLDQLMQGLAQAVSCLVPREAAEPAVKNLLGLIVNWENALYARRLQPAPALAPDDTASFSADAIAPYLQRRFPAWQGVGVSNVRLLTGGFSKTTVLFDVMHEGAETQSWVIRAAQRLDLIFMSGADLRYEYHVLRLVHAAGIPVAKPLWLEQDESQLGAILVVSERAAGRNFGSRIDVREVISDALLRDVMRRLLEIHSVKVDPEAAEVAASHLANLARHRTLTDCIRAQIAFWTERSADFGLPPSPILARALGWLAANVPENAAPPVLLHGDYGLHNLLIDDQDQVSCILDWEASSMGDPADDLVWLSEGMRGSFPRERILELYVELGGQPVSAERMHYFDVMSSVRFAVTCPRALHLFETHPATGLEALQLGLLYMYHGTGGLDENIAKAEAARLA